MHPTESNPAAALDESNVQWTTVGGIRVPVSIANLPQPDPYLDLEDYDPDADLMVLNMGPQHPSTHGVLRLKIHTDGEVVSKIEPVLGYLHRCFEKHCESLPYEQIVPFTDRCDYLASMHMDHAFSMTVEKLLDLELPERVEYIRIIISELQRIASHLMAIGTFGLDVGAITPFTWTLRDRERILDLFEQLCGRTVYHTFPGIHRS